jgi:hypothetical protein
MGINFWKKKKFVRNIPKQKHGKVNQKNNLPKIQFIIEAIFDIYIKKVNKKALQVKIWNHHDLHWIYDKLITKFQ